MKKMAVVMLVGLLLLHTLCKAEEGGPEVEALVKQLGAESFEQRENAAKKLFDLGSKAQAALKTAAQSGEPEVKKRASDLLTYLENRDSIELLSNNEYFPLRLGSTWEYSAGMVVLTNKVDGYEKVGTNFCAKLVTYNNGQPVASESLAVTKDAVLRCSSAGNPVVPPVKVVSLPPKEGDEWKINSTIQGQNLTGTSKVAEEKGVKVQAGSYDAITISSNDLAVSGISMTQKMYLAKDVGMIKQEVTINGNPIKLELVKYTPGQAPAKPATSEGTVGQPPAKTPEAAPPMSGGQ